MRCQKHHFYYPMVVTRLQNLKCVAPAQMFINLYLYFSPCESVISKSEKKIKIIKDTIEHRHRETIIGNTEQSTMWWKELKCRNNVLITRNQNNSCCRSDFWLNWDSQSFHNQQPSHMRPLLNHHTLHQISPNSISQLCPLRSPGTQARATSKPSPQSVKPPASASSVRNLHRIDRTANR